MQVNELRQELAARTMNCKGLKSQLLARLTKTIASEQAKEEGRQDDTEENEKDVSPPPKEEDDKKFRDNKDVRFVCTLFIHIHITFFQCKRQYFKEYVNVSIYRF